MNQTEFWNSVQPFKDKLYRIAKRLLISTDEAVDATQEVLMRLWLKKAKFNEIKSLEGFAVTVTKNYCLDQLKSKRAQNSPLDDKISKLQVVSEDKSIETNETLVFVHKIINQLPEQQRLIIQLRDIEGFDYEEIAHQLNMTETTVRVALSRARKKIREQIIANDEYRK